MSNYSAILRWEQVTIGWDEDVHVVLDQHA